MSQAPSRWPARPSPFDRAKPAEQAIAVAVAKRLAQMSIERKVGQMIQAEIANVTPDDAGQFGLGAILNGGGSFPGGQQARERRRLACPRGRPLRGRRG